MSDLRMPQSNYLHLTGRLCRDPELKYTQSGKPVIKTSMACDNGFGDNKSTMFVTIQIWGDFAEKLHTHLYKGAPLDVEGRLDIYKYETKDGAEKQDTVCVAHRVQILEWRDKGDQKTQERHVKTPRDEHNQAKANGYQPQPQDDLIPENDIPF